MGIQIIEGNFAPGKGSFAIVAARFNQAVVDGLVGGAIEGLQRHGVAEQNIVLVRVPGSFEIPVAAKKLIETGKYSAVICLGAIIRGETDHYDHVAGGAAKGIAQLSMEHGVPVIFGVLTCDTLEQAVNRAGAKLGNKGFEAALAAIEMVDLLGKINR
ncbi:MAG: 6,7-dimethyl-8-ribityllumazine synthase [Gemmataceae bacterium]|nr:6,7-dimethyl-8-ribityllumazine synthase [Gemmataceae bacterium]